MRILFGALIKGLSGFATIIVLSMTLAPPTFAEAEAFGPAPERFQLLQVRLARAMMDVAPELAVAGYAKATGAPEDLVRYQLKQQAAGGMLIAQANP